MSETDISRDLFSRSQDTNWDIICEICCGLRPADQLPEDHKPFIRSLIDKQWTSRQLQRYLKRYFSLAIDCYQTRAEDPVLKVFVLLVSLLDLDVTVNGHQTVSQLVAAGDNDEDMRGLDISLETKVLILTQTLDLLAQRFRHLSLAKSFDLSSFVAKVLRNEDNNDIDSKELIDDDVLCHCFDLTLQLDYELIARHEPLMKQMLIRCNEYADDSEELNAKRHQLFVTLFDVYFKAKKALKLHQLLSDISHELSPHLIHSERQLSRLYGKCILELPFGQTMDLWRLFVTRFDAKHHFWTKLVTIFLHHIRCLDDCIPNQFIPQTISLLNDTKEVLRQSAKSLTTDDEELVHNLLELYIAFESIIILRMNYNRNDLSLEKWSHMKTTNDWFDLSLVYDFSEDYDWKSMFADIHGLSPSLKQLLVKSLCQKFQLLKCLQLNANLSDDQKLVVKASVDQLLSALMANFCVKDLHLFTIQDINAIINDLSRKDLCILTDSLVREVVTDGTEDNKSRFDAKRLLSEGSVWENISFQTAFVSSFWTQIATNFSGRKKRKHSEDEDIGHTVDTILESLTSRSSVWFKYATHSPTTADKDNKLWAIIANAGQQTQDLIQRSEWQTMRVKIPINLLDLFVHCVPLEYLLPSNQMRSLLCLSLVVFSIDLTVEKNVLVLDLLLDSILRIFDGVRSVWLFNYINPSVYLIRFLQCVRNYDNHEKLRVLVTKLVDSFGRNSDQTLELKDKLKENEDTIAFELIVMCETVLLKRYLHVLRMNSVPKYLQKVKELCGPITRELSATIHQRIKRQLTSETSVESLNSVLIIDSFAAVFEFQVSKSTSDEEAIRLKTKWRKLLTKLIDVSVNQLMAKSANESCVKFLALLCVNRKKLSLILPEDFALNLWQVLCPMDGAEVRRPEDSLKKSVKLIDIWNKSEKYEKIFDEMDLFEELNRNRFLATISAQNSFAEVIKPLVIALIKCSSAEEFEHLLQILNTLLKGDDYLNVSYSLQLWLAVFDSDFHLNDQNSAVFRKFLNDLLTLCSTHCQKCNQNDVKLMPEFQLNIKVLALKTVRSVLHVMPTSVITSPQVSLGLHTCIDAKLNDYIPAPTLFYHLFDCIYSALNECLLQHKYIVIASMPSFHAMVESLMKSLMSVSEENLFLTYEPIVRHELEICSKNMDRLLTLTAGLGDEYRPFAPHMMAAYVSHTEWVSVHAVVKKNVMSGVNRLLKLMATDSKAVDMLYSRFNDSKRQIFKLIFDNFDKYYKFKGEI